MDYLFTEAAEGEITESVWEKLGDDWLIAGFVTGGSNCMHAFIGELFRSRFIEQWRNMRHLLRFFCVESLVIRLRGRDSRACDVYVLAC